jgi:hypothetical protein
MRLTKTLLIMMMLAGVATAGALPVLTFTLDPVNGLLAGQAGTSVGWGFTLSTDSGFVTIESFTFGDLTPIGIFSTPGVPSTVASAGSPITTPWIQDIAGLQYDISASSVLGASTLGVMTVIYDAYSDAGLTNQIVFGDSVNAQFNSTDVMAEVDVNGAAPSNVPEPGTMALAAFGAAILLRKRRS